MVAAIFNWHCAREADALAAAERSDLVSHTCTRTQARSLHLQDSRRICVRLCATSLIGVAPVNEHSNAHASGCNDARPRRRARALF